MLFTILRLRYLVILGDFSADHCSETFLRLDRRYPEQRRHGSRGTTHPRYRGHMAREGRRITPGRPTRYANTAARQALETLIAEPSHDHVDRLLESCLAENLVVDVTGSPAGGEPRVRTIVSTTGEPVLPLFTSTDEVRLAVPRQQHPLIRALVLPGAEAFALIESADFVAVQLDAGSIGQVIARSFIERALVTHRS